MAAHIRSELVVVDALKMRIWNRRFGAGGDPPLGRWDGIIGGTFSSEWRGFLASIHRWTGLSPLDDLELVAGRCGRG
jgi:hypothetical protein